MILFMLVYCVAIAIYKRLPVNSIALNVARVLKLLEDYPVQTQVNSFGFGSMSTKVKETAQEKHFGAEI